MESNLDIKKERINKQSIHLLDGSFEAIEAADIINNLLDVKINFHKLQRLSLTEGNLYEECLFDDTQIQELLNEQQIAKVFFRKARQDGKKLKISATIQIVQDS